jgi:hypothetical protein
VGSGRPPLVNAAEAEDLGELIHERAVGARLRRFGLGLPDLPEPLREWENVRYAEWIGE